MAKLDQYYNRSAESDAHIMAMGKSFLITVYCADQSSILRSVEPKEEDGAFHKVLVIRTCRRGQKCSPRMCKY